MILFSRVRGAFRGIEGREWALLGLETFGVVAGILIAFELNEWASRRNEAARHQQLMERLFEESMFDVVALSNMRDGIARTVQGEVAFAEELAAGRCPPKEKWASVATQGMYPALTAPTSVYQELMGAGGLSSVADPDVRIALANFHAGLDYAQRQVDFFRSFRRTVVSDSDPRITITYDSGREEPQVEVYNRTALCGDHAFRNLFASATRSHSVYASFFRDAADNALVMCAAIGESIGKSCADQFPLKVKKLNDDERRLLAETVAAMREDDDG